MNGCRNTACALTLIAGMAHAQAQDGTFSVKQLTPDTALAAARAALDSCRKSGYQVAVAVADRAGVAQVMLRDRFAGAHTVRTAVDKAWTSASFRITTAALALETQSGRPMSGIRSLPRVVAAGGGVPIEAGGMMLGAIAVSGAPGGDADEACAKAGFAAVSDALELE